MNTKSLKKLKKEWPRVLKKGGHFILATNGFPTDEDQLPMLLVDRAEPLDRAFLAKMDRSLDLSKKIIVGKVSIDDGKLAFNISPSSRCKSPALLRKSVRRLAEEEVYKKLKFAKAIRARFRMLDEADLGDGLETADEATVKGGKASKKSKMFGGKWPKILESLKKWHQLFGRRVPFDQVPRAREGLAKTEAALDSWLAKHKGDAEKSDRKAEIDRIKSAIKAARRRLEQLEAAVAGEDRADDVLDALVLGHVVEPEELESAAATLRARARRTTDPDEALALNEGLERLNRACAEAADQSQQMFDACDVADVEGRRELGESCLTTAGALQDVRLAQMDLIQNTTTQGDRYVACLTPEMREAAVTSAKDLLERTLQAPETKQTHEVVERIHRTRELLERAQCFEDSATLRDEHLRAANEQTRGELLKAASSTDANTFNGSILRGNTSSSVLRAGLTRQEGEVFGSATMGPAFDLAEQHPTLRLNQFDEEQEPGSTEAMEATSQTVRAIDASFNAAAERLAPSVSSRLAGLEVEAYHLLPQLRPNGAYSATDPLELPPDLDSLAAGYLDADASRAEAYRQAVLDSAMAFLEREIPTDTAPARTRLAVEAALATFAGPLYELEAVVAAVPDQDHWHRTLSRRDLAGKLEDVGLTPSPDAVVRAFVDAGQSLTQAERERTELANQLEALEEASTVTVACFREAVVDIMERLLADPMAIPRPIRGLVIGAREMCGDIAHADAETVRKVATDVIMLRWLVTRLAVPKPDPETGHAVVPSTLVQLGAVLQLIANGIISNKPPLLPYADLIRAYIPRWHVFLDALIEGTLAENAVNIEPGEHPERGEVAYDSQRPDELAFRDNPKGHWKLCQKYIAKEAASVVKYDLEEAVLLNRGGLGGFFKPLRVRHQQRIAEPDAFELGWRGRTNLLNDTLEDAKSMLVEEGRRALDEGAVSAIFTVLDDEDLYELDEHWEIEVKRRFNTLVNKLLSQEAFHSLSVTSDPIDGLLGDLHARHTGIFDATKHGVLPMKRAKMDSDMAALFDEAESRLTESMNRAVQGEATWFAINP